MKKLKKLLNILTMAFLFLPVGLICAQVELIQTYPSDPNLFTQGLELDSNDNLIVSSGLYKKSSIGSLDLKTGQYQALDRLDDNFFAEGITFTPDHLWQLTWKEETAFKRDLKTLKVIDQVKYTGQGWGLCYDCDRDDLWMSDGSSKIYRRDKDTFELLGQIQVELNGQPLSKINELEYANGLIYANLWYHEQIVAINPDTGQVEKVYDIKPLIQETLSQEEIEKIDSLNGIAHIEGDRFYLTGKNYPVIYEVKLK